MFQYLKYLVLLFVGLCIVLHSNSAYTINIRAKVDDKIITDYDIQKKVDFLNATQSGKYYSEKDMQEVLEGMIEYIIIEKAVVENKISPSRQEIEEAFAVVAHNNNIDVEQFVNVLKNSGITKEAMQNNLKEQLVLKNYKKLFIEPKIYISPVEVQANKQEIVQEILRQSVQWESVQISEILIDRNMLASTEPTLNDYKKTVQDALNAGEEFAVLARKYSRSSSAADGGSLGWMPMRDLSILYRTIVMNLNKGEVSAPYSTEDVLIFLKLDDLKKHSTISADKITDEQIKLVLQQQKVEELMQKQVEQLKKKAYIEIVK